MFSLYSVTYFQNDPFSLSCVETIHLTLELTAFPPSFNARPIHPVKPTLPPISRRSSLNTSTGYLRWSPTKKGPHCRCKNGTGLTQVPSCSTAGPTFEQLCPQSFGDNSSSGILNAGILLHILCLILPSNL